MNEESGRSDEEEGRGRGNLHGWKSNDAKCKNAKWWELNSHFVASEDKG